MQPSFAYNKIVYGALLFLEQSVFCCKKTDFALKTTDFNAGGCKFLFLR